MTTRDGEFVRDQLHDEVEEDAVLSHGVELSIESIFQRTSSAVLTNEEVNIGDRSEIPSRTRRELERQGAGDAVDALRMFGISKRDSTEFYHLSEGAYTIEYDESVTIPEGCKGIVYPTHPLVESGVQLNPSLETTSDDKTVTSTLYVPQPITLSTDFRPVTLVLED